MKPGLHQIGQSGATHGQSPIWDAGTGTWIPGDVGTSTTTTVPLTTTVGGTPALVWDDNDELVLTEVIL